MTLSETIAVVATIQSILMSVATFFVWATGRENKRMEDRLTSIRADYLSAIALGRSELNLAIYKVEQEAIGLGERVDRLEQQRRRQ